VCQVRSGVLNDVLRDCANPPLPFPVDVFGGCFGSSGYRGPVTDLRGAAADRISKGSATSAEACAAACDESNSGATGAGAGVGSAPCTWFSFKAKEASRGPCLLYTGVIPSRSALADGPGFTSFVRAATEHCVRADAALAATSSAPTRALTEAARTGCDDDGGLVVNAPAATASVACATLASQLSTALHAFADPEDADDVAAAATASFGCFGTRLITDGGSCTATVDLLSRLVESRQAGEFGECNPRSPTPTLATMTASSTTANELQCTLGQFEGPVEGYKGLRKHFFANARSLQPTLCGTVGCCAEVCQNLPLQCNGFSFRAANRGTGVTVQCKLYMGLGGDPANLKPDPAFGHYFASKRCA
jgi:hypothetical protein